MARPPSPGRLASRGRAHRWGGPQIMPKRRLLPATRLCLNMPPQGRLPNVHGPYGIYTEILRYITCYWRDLA
jgi:hypothetical protein